MKMRGRAAVWLVMILLPQVAAGNALRAEVLAAIDAAMESRGFTFPKGACSEQLELGAAIPDGSGTRFVVTGMKFDSGLGQARFLLRASGNRKAPPFYAWCKFQGSAALESRGQKNAQSVAGGSEDAALGPVLVDVHRTASLYLHSESSATVVSVRPLQCGHRDERVRVRLPLHGKTVEARVVGKDLVEVAF